MAVGNATLASQPVFFWRHVRCGAKTRETLAVRFSQNDQHDAASGPEPGQPPETKRRIQAAPRKIVQEKSMQRTRGIRGSLAAQVKDLSERPSLIHLQRLGVSRLYLGQTQKLLAIAAARPTPRFASRTHATAVASHELRSKSKVQGRRRDRRHRPHR